MIAEPLMVMLVYRSSLEHDLLALLDALGVEAFTNVPEVLGMGAGGRAFHSSIWPGSNSLVIAVLDAARVRGVVEGLREFRDRTAGPRAEGAVPLHAFVLPCVQAL